MTSIRAGLCLLLTAASAGLAQEAPAPGTILEVEVALSRTTTASYDPEMTYVDEDVSRVLFLSRVESPTERRVHVLEGRRRQRTLERTAAGDEETEVQEVDPSPFVGKTVILVPLPGLPGVYDLDWGEAEWPDPQEGDVDDALFLGAPERWIAYDGAQEGAPDPAQVVGAEITEWCPWPEELAVVVGMLAGELLLPDHELERVRWTASAERADAAPFGRATFTLELQSGRGAGEEREQIVSRTSLQVTVRAPSRAFPGD